MRRIVAIVACGLTVAACSASMPNLFNSSPRTEALRFESEPSGAEVKISSGQSCRTPCELSIQVAPEISAAFALNGYHPQTISVRSETSTGSPHFAPNPVRVELQMTAVTPPAKKRVKKKPAVAAISVNSRPATTAAPGPASASAAVSAPPPTPETAESATNFPWPDPSGPR
jgi:hypothetical protein